MYSGSLSGCPFGVVGVSPAALLGRYSKAVAKLEVVAAVSGAGDSSADLSSDSEG